MAQTTHRRSGRVWPRHTGRGCRPDAGDPAHGLPDSLRTGSDRLDGGAGGWKKPCKTALSLVVRNVAGGVETSRRFVRSALRDARVRSAAEYLDLSGSALRAGAFCRNRHDRGAFRGELEDSTAILFFFFRAGSTGGSGRVLTRRHSGVGPFPAFFPDH